ncbi:MAG: outer membrane beta-barrel protein [Bacteroidota bacterium]
MKLYAFLFATLFTLSLQAQGEFGFGFKAGLNFSEMTGDLETDAQGMAVESMGQAIGFSVGVLANYSFTDMFGVRSELLYSQKGRVIGYDGPSYFVFDATTPTSTIITGDRDYSVGVINSYLEIPLLGYVRLGKFELMGGGYVSGLINSSGDGRLTFTPAARQGTNFDELEVTLDYRYLRDNAGEGRGVTRPFVANGIGVDVFETLGAYYEYDENDKNLYQFFDAGVIGGLSFYFNEGFFLNARVEYGLMDTTRDEVDRSLSEIINGEIQTRSDQDQNFTIHTSVAFRF